jgi:hypothetical protein
MFMKFVTRLFVQKLMKVSILRHASIEIVTTVVCLSFFESHETLPFEFFPEFALGVMSIFWGLGELVSHRFCFRLDVNFPENIDDRTKREQRLT